MAGVDIEAVLGRRIIADKRERCTHVHAMFSDRREKWVLRCLDYAADRNNDVRMPCFFVTHANNRNDGFRVSGVFVTTRQ